MTGYRSKVWTAAGVAVLAGGLAACGGEDVIKEEPTPAPPAATAPGEAGERGQSVRPDDSGESGGAEDGERGGEGGDRTRPPDGVGEGGESGPG